MWLIISEGDYSHVRHLQRLMYRLEGDIWLFIQLVLTLPLCARQQPNVTFNNNDGVMAASLDQNGINGMLYER